MKEGKAEKQNRKDQARDTGLALCLCVLLLIYFGQYFQLIPVTILLLFLSMAWPNLFKPLSKGWFKFSSIISETMSRVILTFLFFGIVTPIGLIRQLIGADPMQFKKWKRGKNSVFSARDKTIEAKDLDQPY
jgi:polyferredoxin